MWLSRTTLIAVPPVLLAHWLTQMGPAINSGCLSVAVADSAPPPSHRQIIFHPRSASLRAKTPLTQPCAMCRHSASRGLRRGVDPESGGYRVARSRKHVRLLFPLSQSAQRPLAGTTPTLLPCCVVCVCRWDVVLVPLQRFSNEHGKPSGPLMRVHWLRLVLDEGHTLGARAALRCVLLTWRLLSVRLAAVITAQTPGWFSAPPFLNVRGSVSPLAGASLSITSKLQVACAIAAERRWVVTGTPTPAAMRGQLSHLRPLLAFLKEGTFGAQEKKWTASVQRPLEGAQRAPGSGSGGGGGGGGTPSDGGSSGGGSGKTMSRTSSGLSQNSDAAMSAEEAAQEGPLFSPTPAGDMPQHQQQDDQPAPAAAADSLINGDDNGNGSAAAGSLGAAAAVALEWDGARERAAAARRLHALLRRVMARTCKARAARTALLAAHHFPERKHRATSLTLCTSPRGGCSLSAGGYPPEGGGPH